MNSQEAAKKLETMDGIPIVRQCMIETCKAYLDMPSMIVATRGEVKHLISHCICSECEAKYIKDNDL